MFILMLSAFVSACSSTEEAYIERPVENLYNEAMDSLEEGDWTDAISAFEEVERQHPYSVWATRAQLMAAFAHYRDDNYDQATLTARRFLELYPGHRDVAYAHYLIALSYYEQITDVGRDQAITREAVEELDQLILRFPASEYARDARLKLQFAKDHLAGKEMEIGRYYLGQKQYLAAINRFRIVVEKYQQSRQVDEALHRLVECYLALGVEREAQTAAAVLIHNAPESEWARYSYAMMTGGKLEIVEDDQSWISRTWRLVTEAGGRAEHAEDGSAEITEDQGAEIIEDQGSETVGDGGSWISRTWDMVTTSASKLNPF